MSTTNFFFQNEKKFLKNIRKSDFQIFTKILKIQDLRTGILVSQVIFRDFTKIRFSKISTPQNIRKLDFQAKSENPRIRFQGGVISQYHGLRPCFWGPNALSRQVLGRFEVRKNFGRSPNPENHFKQRLGLFRGLFVEIPNFVIFWIFLCFFDDFFEIFCNFEGVARV